MSNIDEWRATWDWAGEIWGDNEDYSFEQFFRAVANKMAEAIEWEELGSSDVWHLTVDTVRRVKSEGVETRRELVKRVLEMSGYFHGLEMRAMVVMYGEPGGIEGMQKLFAPA